ncbi:2-dehydropantoate 2-reductase [candidate division KSB1 bacterium]|nr:2-dehydropantoate 2-reductase [candidate division KSB1 bacterium]
MKTLTQKTEPMTFPRNITIFGVGAIATLFGFFLNKVSDRITLFGAWTEQINAITENGLTFMDPDGNKWTRRLNITNNLHHVPPTDVALILVKSYQTKRTGEQVKGVLRPNGLAVTLQNGLGNVEILQEALGEDRVVAGITYHAANLSALACVQHAGAGKTFLGMKVGRETQLNEIVNLLNKAGIQTELIKNIASLSWSKLIVNAGINPLTALLEIENGDLLHDPLLGKILAATVQEVAAVATRHGISLPHSDPVEHVFDICRATARNRSSMLQDIVRGAKTEIEAINGAVVDLGVRYGIPTPVNQFLLEQVQSKQAGETFEPDRLNDLEAWPKSALQC